MKLIRLLKHDIASDARSWVSDGIISREQAQLILARYGVHIDERRPSFVGHLILSAIGMLCLGIAVILLVSNNWEEIPRFVRMSSLIGLTVIVNGFGIRSWAKDNINRAKNFFILGSLCYGASIFLIAQIYHLGEHFPDGILYWILGILPIAYLSGSLVVALIASTLTTLYIITEAQTGGIAWMGFLFSLISIHFSLKERESGLLFLSAVVSLFTGLEIIYSHFLPRSSWSYGFDGGHLFATLAVAFIAYLLGAVLRRENKRPLSDYGLLLQLWMLRLGLFILFFLSFEEAWRWSMKDFAQAGAPAIGTIALFFVGSMSMLALALKKAHWDIVRNGLVSSLALGLLITFAYFGSTPELGHLVVNIIILALGIGFIVVGSKSDENSRIILGTTVLLILAFVRYIDLIGDYVGASILFFIEGAVLLGMSKYLQGKSSSTAEQEVSPC